MNLTNKVQKRYDHDIQLQPMVQCKFLKDNSGALELVMTPKMRPRTKQINVNYHHFRDYVKRKLLTILPICSEDNNLADNSDKTTTKQWICSSNID